MPTATTVTARSGFSLPIAVGDAAYVELSATAVGASPHQHDQVQGTISLAIA